MTDQTAPDARELVKARFAERLAAAAADRPPADDREAELLRVAQAARVLIARLVASEAPADTLAATADDLESAAAHLLGFRQGTAYEFGESANAGGSPVAHFDHSPLLGRANPLAPPLVIGVDGDKVVGRVTFSDAYEGPPGCVHGGFVAAMFDEVLGAAQTFSGQPGMTGTLTVRYRSPTPLRTELLLEGRLERVEGRKNFVYGRCEADGRLTAEAEGIFISIDPARFASLREARDERVEADRAAHLADG